MTTAIFAQVPLAIGASLLSLVGKGARWSAIQFMRSPVASTGLVLVSGLTLVAGANALYLQDTPHPAPLFAAPAASESVTTPPPLEPVVAPAARPDGLVAQPSQSAETGQTTPETSVRVAEAAPATANEQSATSAIGNPDIAELQEKLKALGLFDGTVDGYYGPKTADAIRAFEQRNGLPRTGAATPQVIQAVRNAPLTTSDANAPVQETSERFEVAANGDIGDLIVEMEQQGGPAPVRGAEQQSASTGTTSGAPAEAAAIDPATLAEQREETVAAAQAPVPAALDRELISDIQRGLSRLGFLQAGVTGVADEHTARAIRKFQIFNNYTPTGEVSPVVYQMLVEAGAYL